MTELMTESEDGTLRHRQERDGKPVWAGGKKLNGSVLGNRVWEIGFLIDNVVGMEVETGSV